MNSKFQQYELISNAATVTQVGQLAQFSDAKPFNQGLQLLMVFQYTADI